ncbi:MAG: hypothetical protein QG552_269 [Thermodesulfobacteriota bacterium]|nr:hypothetical protein [Thermodesulfobacteriota bacterium]
MKTIFKKPVLSRSDQLLEERKAMVKGLIRKCRSRAESVKLLIDFSKCEDALAVLESLMPDLLKLISVIYDVERPPTLEDAEITMEKWPDRKVSGLFHEFIIAHRTWMPLRTIQSSYRVAYKTEKALERLLSALEKAYRNLKKHRIRTQLDDYERRLRYVIATMIFLVLLAGGVLWAGLHMLKVHMIEKANAELGYLADLAYKAKEKTGRSLVQITGSACSYCVCKESPDLRHLSEDDRCVKTAYAALGRMYGAVKDGKEMPEELKTDAWGSPFLLDENEMEFREDDGRQDLLISVGPDRILGTKDDLTAAIKNAFVK